jgi:hypothetical protein
MILPLIILGLTVAVTAAPVAAGGGSISIGDGGADGEFVGTFDSTVGSGVWNQGPPPLCDFVAYRNIAAQDVETRSAIEFPLPALPPGATITGATLSLNGRTVDDPAPIAIYGYAGNGTTEEADVTVTGTPALVPPPPSPQFVDVDYDVTDLVTPAMFTAGWAGFSFRLSDLGDGTNGSVFQCTEDPAFPVLTITYDLPNPPTPAASLLNAAMGDSGIGSPWAAAGFAALLLSALGALALASVRGGFSRP